MASLRLIVCALALAACYDVPQPECGFQCGPGGVCPDGYACNEDRCELDNGRSFTCPAIMQPPVSDVIPPSVMARSPTADETDVALDAVVLVTFDEAVVGVNQSTFGVSRNGNFVEGTITEISSQRAWRFTPNRLLVINGVYEVVLGSAIEDLARNPLPETRWMFSTIEDTTGPMVIGSNPMSNSLDAPVTGRLSVSFDEAVIGVTTSSVRLEQNGTSIPVTLSTPLPNTVEIDHASTLAGETVYDIVLGSGITDMFGNALTPITLSFTTRDTTPPMLVTRSPLPGATNVSNGASVSLTFSEVLGDQNLSLSQGATPVDTTFVDAVNPDDSYTLTLTPMAPLTPDTVYTVNVGIVRDLSLNATTIPSYTFTTAP